MLTKIVDDLSKRSRLKLSLEVTPRTVGSPLRLSNSQFRKIGKSLLFIADVTPISAVTTDENTESIVDSNVCVELGYGIQTKDNGQILLLNRSRSDLSGTMPFEMASYKQLSFDDGKQLEKSLPKLIDALLQRYSLY